MREILFKAKRKDNGEWVEGYYCKTTIGNDVRPSDVIFVPFKVSRNEEWGWMKVDSDTLCQYTGLTDKNGNKIWENDILRIGENEKLMVSWHHFKASWVLSKKGWMYNHFFGESVEPEDVEVVGNIFDGGLNDGKETEEN
jgi:hypothetical protein